MDRHESIYLSNVDPRKGHLFFFFSFRARYARDELTTKTILVMRLQKFDYSFFFLLEKYDKSSFPFLRSKKVSSIHIFARKINTTIVDVAI